MKKTINDILTTYMKEPERNELDDLFTGVGSYELEPMTVFDSAFIGTEYIDKFVDPITEAKLRKLYAIACEVDPHVKITTALGTKVLYKLERKQRLTAVKILKEATDFTLKECLSITREYLDT